MCRIIGRAFEALRAGTTFSPKLLRCFCADRDSRQAPHHPAIRIAGSNSLAAARLQHAPRRVLENIRRRAQPRIHQARLTPHSRAQPPGVSEQAWSEHNGRPWPLVTLRQIHSDIIHCMTAPSQQTLAGDGLITRTPGIVLAILTADCLLLILADTKRPTIGVFHARMARHSETYR